MIRSGFTLLETILAMTMLSVILLTASYLDVAATRLTNATNGEVALRNNLLYAARILEKDIQEADVIDIQVVPATEDLASDAHYEFILKHLDGTADINYVINLTPGSETITNNVIGNLFPSTITPKLKYNNNVPQPPFSVAFGKIVSLNFAAETALPGTSLLSSSSVSKSILLRAATVTGGTP